MSFSSDSLRQMPQVFQRDLSSTLTNGVNSLTCCPSDSSCSFSLLFLHDVFNKCSTRHFVLTFKIWMYMFVCTVIIKLGFKKNISCSCVKGMYLLSSATVIWGITLLKSDLNCLYVLSWCSSSCWVKTFNSNFIEQIQKFKENMQTMLEVFSFRKQGCSGCTDFKIK